MPEPTLLPLDDARVRLGLDAWLAATGALARFETGADRVRRLEATPLAAELDRTVPGWRDKVRALHPARYDVRHYPGQAAIGGDIDPDALPRDEQIAGIVVDGDLDLEGAILDRDADAPSAFLRVRGTLRCRGALLGGMHLAIGGDLIAAGPLVLCGPAGRLEVAGDVRAERIVVDGAAPAIGGRILAPGWTTARAAGLDLRVGAWADEIRPEWRDRLLGTHGDALRGRAALLAALFAGEDVFAPDGRSGVSPTSTAP